ncbi:Zn-dependent alcohol dehydrogenase [Halobacteriales archaeon QS_1_68_17]|nr:MAG: Zn-dependent alcohol dehydrogenase [Halobacteriales archaeon QS_1_68_17]
MKALVLDGEWSPRSGYDLAETERQRRTAMDASSVWREPTLRVAERERPEPAADEVLVAVRYAGVCGSDISLIETDKQGYVHYSAYASLPNVLGHEFAGEVVETGSDARLFEPGDRVTAEVTDYCGRCDQCRNGFTGHCENFEQLGFTIPGAFAEYVAVPEKLCYDVSSLSAVYDDEDALMRAAVTVEPSTITYHGLFGRAAGLRPGDYYAFHGLGPIGLTGMNVARAAGAGVVVGFEPSAERRAVAREAGFEHVYDPTETDPTAAVAEATDGAGIDVHVETAGAVRATYPAIERTLAETANVVHISNAGEPAPVDMRHYQASAAQIYGAEGHTGDRIFQGVIRLMAAGHLDNRPLITATYDLDDADAAIRRAAERVDGKILVEV